MPEDRSWPRDLGEFNEVVDLFEDALANTRQTTEELRARARELREEAAHTDIDGFRNAALAMAERYEHAAAERVLAR